jgi:hypothetical protein
MAVAVKTLAGSDRPPSVVWAAVLSVINGVGGFIFSAAWPDVDERATTVVVSGIVGAIMIGAAWWLLGGVRWGAFATLAVNGFNILLGVPAYFADVRAAFIVGATISIVLSALIIAFVLSPAARSFWGNRAGAMAT